MFAVRGWGGFGWLMFEEVSGAQRPGHVVRWPGRPGHVARTARTCGPDGCAGVPLFAVRGWGGGFGWLMFEEVYGSDFFALRGWGSAKEFICSF